MKKLYLLAIFLTTTFFLFQNQAAAQACVSPSAQIDLDANFVSSRLLTGGNFWWDLSDGKYIVPKNGQTAALFAGALWMGGLDPGGNLHLAGQTYGASNGQWEYWPGPLNDDGTTNAATCDEWDRFFEVNRADIQSHQTDWADDHVINGPIPESVRGWPGVGNPHFFDVHGFDLPNTSAGLAPFSDRDGDGIYDPEQGDYPLGKGDQSIWWVYNDEGGGAIHGESLGLPLKMEVQVNAFSFETGPGATETTTFYDFRLIYRGAEPLTDFWLSMWVDPDLGCWQDDYIGCNPEEELAYIYNGDANDQNCSGLIGYGTSIPLLGVKVLKSFAPGGAANTGLSKFMFFNNPSTGSPPAQTLDPAGAPDFYNYMQGRWLDGSSLAQGGNGYDPAGTPADFAFNGNPSDVNSWSECTANNVPGDRRFLISFGPYDLQPGDIGELSFAVVWLPSQPHPCPDVSDLVDAANEMEVLYEEHSEEILVTSTQDFAAVGTVRISPNPVTAEATLQVTAPGVELRSVQLFSASGNLVVKNDRLSGAQAVLEMEGLANGLYLYRAMLSDGKVAVGKVVLEK